MRLTRQLVLGAAALTALAGTARAQQVRFAGSTEGCFYSGALAPTGATPCVLGAAATLPGGSGISFNAGTFDIFTDPAAMSGTSYGAIGNVLASNSLGTVSSSGATFSATGSQYLRLRITFSTPVHTADVNGASNDNVFDVDYLVTGSTGGVGQGGVNFIPTGFGLVNAGFGAGVVFDPVNGVVRTGNFYTGGFINGDVYPTGPGGGTAAGTVNYHTLDTRSITGGGTSSLTSFLQIESTVTGVPEPATVALMATGLVGILGAGFVRRRNDA
jgi:hypothetical protein